MVSQYVSPGLMSDPHHTEETRTAQPRGALAPPGVRIGEKVGRFSILSEVGAGGMGRIYEAYDPNLDRRVALKLLHESGEDGHRQRLVREAQALARLDHPNVVRVHDVGVHEGAVFVAMEFVRGGTLKEWLAENPVGSRERFETAIGLLVDAGRGLVAAHEAGLVHRDVKPSNILIGDDGRARVADFGIARALDSQPARSESPESAVSGEEVLLSTDDSSAGLTGTGATVGTPAYMAPEQIGGGRVDAAADQFSFCVTAWELLFGVRPFAGKDARERLAAIRRGEPKRPEGVEVDAEVLALLERGLRYRSSARHRRLEDLVDALSLSSGTGGRSGRRFGWRSGLAVLGVGLLGVGAAYRMGQNEQLCTGAAAAFEDVWDDGRRQSVRAVVLGSGLEFAPGAWARLESGLDAYGEAWRAAHTDACEATQVRGEQSPERMEERLACLDDAKRSVEALVMVVLSGEASVIASEAELLEGLPEVDDCADVRGQPTRAELSMLDAVAQAGAERSAGQPARALRIIEPIAEKLDEETSPLVRAGVLLEYGRVLSEAHGERAIDVLSEAYAVAHAAGLRNVAAAAARNVTRQHALLLGKPETVRTWLELAKFEGATTAVPQRTEVLVLEGMLSNLDGDDEGATRAFERSVEVASVDPALFPHALRNLALNLRDVDSQRGVEVGRRALETYQAEFGSHHPGAAIFEETLAGLLVRVGENDEADALARHALARATDVWGEGHVATSRYLVQLSKVRCSQFGDRDEGRQLAEDALRLHLKGEATPTRYEALAALEGCVRSYEPAVAKEVAREMLELTEKLYGGEHFRTVYVRAMYALALLQTSDVEGASRQVSLATMLTDDRAPGWDIYNASQAHGVLGGLASVLGERTLALRHAEAALALDEKTDSVSPGNRVFAHAELCSARRLVGELERALADCLVGLQLSGKLDQQIRLARLEYETGWILNVLRRDDEALSHMENAVRIFNELNGPGSYYGAVAVLGLARVNEELGRYAEAEKQFRTSFKSLSMFKDTKVLPVESGAGAARMAARQGRVDEALAELDTLEELAGEVVLLDHAHILESRGFVLHIQDPRNGSREYSRAINFYRFAHVSHLVERACRKAPFDLPECKERGVNPH